MKKVYIATREAFCAVQNGNVVNSLAQSGYIQNLYWSQCRIYIKKRFEATLRAAGGDQRNDIHENVSVILEQEFNYCGHRQVQRDKIFHYMNLAGAYLRRLVMVLV